MRSFLTALARDARANTIAIMAIALIPLAGIVGGGVDISRMYIVKTRLQHACDAGALAGRKAMGGGTWSQSSYYPRTAAERFFDANIKADPYGATNLTRSFTENAGRVTGTASADLPMTLMRIFGRTTETLSVTCDAEMRLPNTDVMFVLDVTGSMGDKAVSSDSTTKIVALRTAVKCFYEIVARLDTDATCAAGAPSGGTGDQVQIRFGFVPYSTNVNVGKLLPTSFFANSWPYQSREAVWQTQTQSGWGTPVDSAGPSGNDSGTWSNWSAYSGWGWIGSCNEPADSTVGPTTTTSDTPVSIVNGNQVWQTRTTTGYIDTEYQVVTSWIFCQVQVRTRTRGTYTTIVHTAAPATTTTRTFQQWHYGRITQDISGLKNGSNWNDSVQMPVGPSGTMTAVDWDGCIEERATVRQSSYDPIPSGAKDLQIDLAPDQNDATTLWGPALPGAIFTRNATSQNSGSNNGFSLSDSYTSTDYKNNSDYFCPAEARKLQTWTDASAFAGYVDGLQPTGNTYHDIGLIWGARLMSPTGIFRSENEFTPRGGEIERHLIFMTDGEACTGDTNYTAYGIAWFDRRQTDPNQVPTDGCLTTGTLTQQVNARTAALCTAIKNKNITLWVIWFGASNTTIEGMLQTCATSGRFFAARNATELQNTFKSIADQISQLRLTR